MSIGRFFSRVFEAWFGTIFFLSLTLLYPVFYWMLSKPSRFPAAFGLMRWWALVLQVSAGVRLSIKQEGKLPNGAYVIAPNHSSYIDIILMYRVFKKYFVFMGKQELSTWPMFRIFFTKNMNISVDRSSRTGSARAFVRAKQEVQKGHPIVIFPEGTIPDDTPNLMRFKDGAFKLGIEMQIPVVPVTFLTNHRLNSMGLKSGRSGPGVSRIIIHEPISTIGLTEADIPALREKVFGIIQTTLQQSYKS